MKKNYVFLVFILQKMSYMNCICYHITGFYHSPHYRTHPHSITLTLTIVSFFPAHNQTLK